LKVLTDDDPALTADAIRRLIYRRDVAVARYRAALARTLLVTDVEMLALIHLAEQGELAPSALASMLDLSSGGATALVQRLERQGHVSRKPHPNDRRSTLIHLTPTTAARLEEAESSAYATLASGIAALRHPEQVAVRDSLSRLATLSEELAASIDEGTERPEDVLARPVPSLWA
jgi:DNA-binding MarR family transcriptional regulator